MEIVHRHKSVADQAESEGIPQVARHAGGRPPIDLNARTGRHLATSKPEETKIDIIVNITIANHQTIRSLYACLCVCLQRL